MSGAYRVGDLVHVPQSVDLIDCGRRSKDDPQLTIPLRVLQTQAPKIGVITDLGNEGYIRIYCEGAHWSVRNQSIYKLGDKYHD